MCTFSSACCAWGQQAGCRVGGVRFIVPGLLLYWIQTLSHVSYGTWARYLASVSLNPMEYVWGLNELKPWKPFSQQLAHSKCSVNVSVLWSAVWSHISGLGASCASVVTSLLRASTFSSVKWDPALKGGCENLMCMCWCLVQSRCLMKSSFLSSPFPSEALFSERERLPSCQRGVDPGSLGSYSHQRWPKRVLCGFCILTGFLSKGR